MLTSDQAHSLAVFIRGGAYPGQAVEPRAVQGLVNRPGATLPTEAEELQRAIQSGQRHWRGRTVSLETMAAVLYTLGARCLVARTGKHLLDIEQYCPTRWDVAGRGRAHAQYRELCRYCKLSGAVVRTLQGWESCGPFGVPAVAAAPSVAATPTSADERASAQEAGNRLLARLGGLLRGDG